MGKTLSRTKSLSELLAVRLLLIRFLPDENGQKADCGRDLMATIVAPSFAITRFDSAFQWHWKARELEVAVVSPSFTNCPETEQDAVVMAADSQKNFLLLRLLTPVPFKLPSFDSLEANVHGADWESFVITVSRPRGEKIRGNLGALEKIGGSNYWRLLGFPRESVFPDWEMALGAPVVQGGQLIGMFAGLDRDGGFALAFSEILDSDEMDIRALIS